jgi:hypothetical protein
LTDPPTGTAIAGSVYLAKTGGSALVPPVTTTSSTGEFELWFDTSQYVDVVITDNSHTAFWASDPTHLVRFTVPRMNNYDLPTTAGSVTVSTDAIFVAKGDLPVGTGTATAARLPVGANDTIIMADSGEATGLKYVAPASPSTQAFGDSAATGTSDTYTRGDHKHAMPTAAITTSGLTQTTGTLLGRTTAATGAIEQITAGSGLTLSAGTLSATGGASTPGLSFVLGALTYGNGISLANAKLNNLALQNAVNALAVGGTLRWPSSGVIELATTVRLVGDERNYEGPQWAYPETPLGCVFSANVGFQEPALTVTGASWAAGTATYTVADSDTGLNHTLAGDGTANSTLVDIAGITSTGPGSYNVSAQRITAFTGTTIKVAIATDPGTFSSAGAGRNVTWHTAGAVGLFETDCYYDGGGGKSVPDRGMGIKGTHLYGNLTTAGYFQNTDRLNGLICIPDRSTFSWMYIAQCKGRAIWFPDTRADGTATPNTNRVDPRIDQVFINGCGNNASLGYVPNIDVDDTQLTDGTITNVHTGGGKNGIHINSGGGWRIDGWHTDSVKVDALKIDNATFTVNLSNFFIDDFGSEATAAPYYGIRINNISGGPPNTGSGFGMGVVVMNNIIVRHKRQAGEMQAGGAYAWYKFTPKSGSGAGRVSMSSCMAIAGDQATNNVFTLTTSVNTTITTFVGTSLIDVSAQVPFDMRVETGSNTEQVQVTAAPYAGGGAGAASWTVVRNIHESVANVPGTGNAHTQPITCKQLLDTSGNVAIDSDTVNVQLSAFGSDNINKIFAANSDRVNWDKSCSFANRVIILSSPTEGYWRDGGEIWHSDPAAGGVPGMVCTTAGTPGTWRNKAALA